MQLLPDALQHPPAQRTCLCHCCNTIYRLCIEGLPLEIHQQQRQAAGRKEAAGARIARWRHLHYVARFRSSNAAAASDPNTATRAPQRLPGSSQTSTPPHSSYGGARFSRHISPLSVSSAANTCGRAGAGMQQLAKLRGRHLQGRTRLPMLCELRYACGLGTSGCTSNRHARSTSGTRLQLSRQAAGRRPPLP